MRFLPARRLRLRFWKQASNISDLGLLVSRLYQEQGQSSAKLERYLVPHQRETGGQGPLRYPQKSLLNTPEREPHF